MSRAVRIKERLLVRLIRKALISQKNKKRNFFAATDINLSQDRWVENSILPLPELVLAPIPDICLLSVPDLSLTDPFAVTSKNSNQDGSNVSSALQLPNPATNDLSAIPSIESMHDKALDVEELVQALEISGVKVNEVRALPTGGSCIRVDDLFVNCNEPEYEYVEARRK